MKKERKKETGARASFDELSRKIRQNDNDDENKEARQKRLES